MSHETFDQDYLDEAFDDPKPAGTDGNKPTQVLKYLPHRRELEESQLLVRSPRNGTAGTQKTSSNGNKNAVSGTDTGFTAATSGPHQYFASRQLFGSVVFGGDHGKMPAINLNDIETKTDASG